MPRKLGTSFQGLVNKWVNVNRENVVFGDEGEIRQQVIIVDDEPTTVRPKSSLRKNKNDISKSKSSGRRRHHQLANGVDHDKINPAAYYGHDDEKSISSGRTTVTASTHSTLRSAASAGSVPSCSSAPADDESVSSFSKRLKLSNGGAAGLLPPPAVPGVYYDNEFHGRHGMTSPPPPAVPEHNPAVPEHIFSGATERRPADVPGVYYGVEYGGSSVPTTPIPSPAVDPAGAPAVLPAPPGLVVGGPILHPGMPKPTPPQMQMDHRVYYPPQQGPVPIGQPQAHHMQSINDDPPPEIIARQYPQRSSTPMSPQILPAQPSAQGVPGSARPVGPPPMMHFIHQHPPATPIPAKSSNVQIDTARRASAGESSEDDMNEETHIEDEAETSQATDERIIQADTVQSSSAASNEASVHFADETAEAPMSPESATSEIEAKMDAALVLSALSFSKQGGPTKGKSEAKGKKGLLLRKARSPKDARSSPGSMISWKATRAARAADNDY